MELCTGAKPRQTRAGAVSRSPPINCGMQTSESPATSGSGCWWPTVACVHYHLIATWPLSRPPRVEAGAQHPHLLRISASPSPHPCDLLAGCHSVKGIVSPAAGVMWALESEMLAPFVLQAWGTGEAMSGKNCKESVRFHLWHSHNIYWYLGGSTGGGTAVWEQE